MNLIKHIFMLAQEGFAVEFYTTSSDKVKIRISHPVTGNFREFDASTEVLKAIIESKNGEQGIIDFLNRSARDMRRA